MRQPVQRSRWCSRYDGRAKRHKLRTRHPTRDTRRDCHPMTSHPTELRQHRSPAGLHYNPRQSLHRLSDALGPRPRHSPAGGFPTTAHRAVEDPTISPPLSGVSYFAPPLSAGYFSRCRSVILRQQRPGRHGGHQGCRGAGAQMLLHNRCRRARSARGGRRPNTPAGLAWLDASTSTPCMVGDPVLLVQRRVASHARRRRWRHQRLPSPLRATTVVRLLRIQGMK